MECHRYADTINLPDFCSEVLNFLSWQRVTSPLTLVHAAGRFRFRAEKHFDIARSFGSSIGFEVHFRVYFVRFHIYYFAYSVYSYRTCSILL
jgi:hypothetical protein